MTQIYHLVAWFLLLAAFILLSKRQVAAIITIYRTEALLLSTAAFTQGFAQNSPELYLTGIITVCVKVVLLPMALRRIAQRLNLTRAVEATMPAGISMILGAALIGIAMIAVHPSTNAADFGIALSVVLLGLLVLITKRNALSQVIGFLSTENGLMLAAIGLPGLPLVAELSVALLVLSALFVAGVFMFRLREDVATPDLTSQ